MKRKEVLTRGTVNKQRTIVNDGYAGVVHIIYELILKKIKPGGKSGHCLVCKIYVVTLVAFEEILKNLNKIGIRVLCTEADI